MSISNKLFSVRLSAIRYQEFMEYLESYDGNNPTEKFRTFVSQLLEKGIETISKDPEQKLIQFQKANRCSNCMASPFRDKNDRLAIVCMRPVFKQNKYGDWKPSGKNKGEVPLEDCLGYLKYRMNKDKVKKDEKEFEIQLLRDDIQKLKLALKREKEEDKLQGKLESMSRGEMILCHLPNINRIMPLAKCFEIQDEKEEERERKGQQVIDQLNLPANERCPCGKFKMLEAKEMEKWKDDETIPFMDAEIRKHYLKTVQDIDLGTYETMQEVKTESMEAER